MKAKKVYEFRQGGNPYETMGLGAFKIGDRLKCLYTLGWSSHANTWILKQEGDRRGSVIWEDTIDILKPVMPASGESGDDWSFNGYGLTEDVLRKYFKRV
jgi:hypothetical protein